MELGPILFGGVEKIIDFLRQKQLLASIMDCSKYAKFYNLYYNKELHCKNKITNLFVSTVARNNLNCNLIGCVCYYPYTVIIIK